MTRDGASQVWTSATQCIVGVIGVAALTFVCLRLQVEFAAAGFAYLILIAALSLIGSFVGSVVVSAAAALCLVYFFTRPAFSFSVDVPQDLLALAAFLTTSIIVSGLTARVRRVAEASQTSQDALRRSEEEWKEVFEHNPVMYFMVDAAGTVLSVNAFGAAQLGYTVGELVGQSVVGVFLEEDRALVRANLAVCTATPGHAHAWEIRKIRKNRTVLWVRENAKAVRRAEDQLIVLIACEDITERKRTEDALRESEAYLAEAQRLSRTGSFGWRVATGELIWSEETFRIFGYDRTTTPSRDLVVQRTHPDERAAFEQFLAHMAREPADWDQERRLLMPDGSIKQVRVVARAVRDAQDNLEFVGAIMDVTASRRAEEQLILAREELAHVARVTTVGELTAAIAHEINQPLTGLVTSGHAAQRWMAAEPPNLDAARRAIERMINDGTRAAEVISRIRAMVRKAPPRRDALDINDTVTEVITLIRREVQRNDITLRAELADDLPQVPGDRIQLQQVVLNLIVNAIDALKAVTPSQREITVASAADAPGGVRVTVRDSGSGFDGRSVDRLFDAFYTTKPEGMGMGLAISRTIIEAHGGRLSASPNEPKGAIFSFSLPIDAARPVAADPVPADPAS
jgi:PAS domain S-box-containing protein